MRCTHLQLGGGARRLPSRCSMLCITGCVQLVTLVVLVAVHACGGVSACHASVRAARGRAVAVGQCVCALHAGASMACVCKSKAAACAANKIDARRLGPRWCACVR